MYFFVSPTAGFITCTAGSEAQLSYFIKVTLQAERVDVFPSISLLPAAS